MVAALVVDDSEIAREFLTEIIERLGLRPIRHAENGAECLKAIRAFSPDVVFLDIEMPVMDGLQTLKEIRRFDKRTVVIMMTSVGDEATVRACIEGGTNHYIHKDLPEEKIEARLGKILSGAFRTFQRRSPGPPPPQ